MQRETIEVGGLPNATQRHLYTRAQMHSLCEIGRYVARPTRGKWGSHLHVGVCCALAGTRRKRRGAAAAPPPRRQSSLRPPPRHCPCGMPPPALGAPYRVCLSIAGGRLPRRFVSPTNGSKNRGSLSESCRLGCCSLAACVSPSQCALVRVAGNVTALDKRWNNEQPRQQHAAVPAAACAKISFLL